MKRILSLSAIGMAALGTSLWAQQVEEPGPAQPPAAASSSADDRYRAELDSPESPDIPATASTSAEPALPRLNTSGQQIPRATARAASPNSRSTGTGRSYSGEPGVVVSPPYPNGYASAPSGYATPSSGFGGPSYPSGLVAPQYNPGGLPYPSYGYGQPAMGNGLPQTREDAQSAREFRETVEALRKAKTDEEKAEVRDKLNSLVAKQLDQDLADREKRLQEIEAKAKSFASSFNSARQPRPRFKRC